MDEKTVRRLIELNREFYTEFGSSFALTRRRIQPGVRRILNSLPDGQNWIDLGCGSGALAVEWTGKLFSGSYTGLDFSPALLNEAWSVLSQVKVPDGLNISFYPTDLTSPGWAEILPGGILPHHCDGVLAFAVLHHIPSYALRGQVLRQAASLLKPGGRFIHSEWQFQHSARISARQVGWEEAGLRPAELEEGDTLLDWRHPQPGSEPRRGLRYVHLFSRLELARLAQENGFEILDEFESDGQGGRLGLYQVWEVLS
jgi:SAM-dependent methyltransferase